VIEADTYEKAVRKAIAWVDTIEGVREDIEFMGKWELDGVVRVGEYESPPP